MDQLPRLGKRELICLLSFTCNYVVFVWRGFLFLWVLGMGYVILLWHSLSLPYNYFAIRYNYVKITNKLITFSKKPRRTPAFTHGIDGIDSIIIRIVTLNKPDILTKVLKERFQGDQCFLEDNLKFSLTKLCASRVQDKC